MSKKLKKRLIRILIALTAFIVLFVLDKIFVEDYAKNVLKQFIGKQKQIPPIYSAIKVNGKKFTLNELLKQYQKGEKQ